MRFWDWNYEHRRLKWADASLWVLMGGQMVSCAAYWWRPMWVFAFVTAVLALVVGSLLGSLGGWANPYSGHSLKLYWIWYWSLGIGVVRGILEVLVPWVLG